VIPHRVWVDRQLLDSNRRHPGSRPILVQIAGGEIVRGRRARILGPSEVVYDQRFSPALVRVETYAPVEVDE
jgi:hypothetical protein